MKMKRLVCIALTLAVLSQLFGCSSTSDATTTTEVTQTTTEVTTTTEETTTQTTTEATTTTEETTTEPEDTAIELKIGDSDSIENVCDFTLEHIDITNTITPKNYGSGPKYGRLVAEDGYVYVDFLFCYTNTSNKGVKQGELFRGKLFFTGKYEYENGWAVTEVLNRAEVEDDPDHILLPLSTEFVHFEFYVPEKLSESLESLQLRVTIGEKEYKCNVRGAADDAGKTDVTTESKPGEIDFDDLVILDNDYVTIKLVQFGDGSRNDCIIYKVENKYKNKIWARLDKAYIDDESVSVIRDCNTVEVHPGKTTTMKYIISKGGEKHIPLESLEELYHMDMVIEVLLLDETGEEYTERKEYIVSLKNELKKQ